MKHITIDDCNQEGNYDAIDEYHLAGLGNTLEKNYKCNVCGRTWREVWVHSCQIDNETEKQYQGGLG